MFIFIANLIQWITGVFSSGFVYIGDLWNRFIQFTTVDLPAWFMTQVSGLTAYLSTDPFTGLMDKLDMIDYIFPVYALLTIYVAALGLTASIRLGRWVWELLMSIIP